MKYGIDHLSDEVARVAGANIRVRHDLFLEQTKCTPIEALFYSAFVAQIDNNVIMLPYTRGKLGATEGEAADQIHKLEVGGIGIFPQCQLPGWRVDFLIGIRADEALINWLIAECDGHDFHERTKEQAAKDRSRDREFQAKGYPVFRFTGSELYRAPYAKAGEAFMQMVRQIYPWL